MLTKKGDFIVTQALFAPSIRDTFEALGIEVKEDMELEAAPLRFRYSNLVCYNDDSEGRTIIRLLHGEGYKLDVTFEEFDKFILNLEGI